MSYCRFSSDDFQCDAYVYESAAGFVVHVAGSRVVFAEPLPPPVPIHHVVDFLERHQRVMTMVDAAQRVPIEHPDAGQTFVFSGAFDAAKKLAELRDEGFRLPADAIDALFEDGRGEDR